MKEDLFTESMRARTDAELAEVVADRASYEPSALHAAVLEMKQRGIAPADADSILQKAEEAVNAAESKTKDRWDTHQHVEDESAPELYSKRVIYTFSFLFSVLFGAVLMVMNLRRLNKPEGVVPTVSFSIAFFLSITYLEDLLETSYGFTLPNSNVFAFLGAWLILELVWNKYIGRQLQYRRRSYTKPMIVGIVIAAVFILATIYSTEAQ